MKENYNKPYRYLEKNVIDKNQAEYVKKFKDKIGKQRKGR